MALASRSVMTYQVVLAGDVTVGKTSIWRALQTLPFKEDTSDLVEEKKEFDYPVKLADGTVVTLRVIDTGGIEKYHTFTVHQYRYGSAIVFTYAIDNTSSFYSLPDWIEQSHTANWLQDGFASFIVGNKTDADRAVDLISQQQLIYRFQNDRVYSSRVIDGFEVSARADSHNYNVRAAFDEMAQILHDSFRYEHES